jgi:transposase
MEASMTIKITCMEHDAASLRWHASRARSGSVSRRLLALAMVLEGQDREIAARQCGMTRQTLRDWVHRYNAEGIAGLEDRPHGGGAQRALSAAQEALVAAWVESGPDVAKDGVVRWRRADLGMVIEREFGVVLHDRSVGKILYRLGFSHVSSRPRHPLADLEAQEAHKKTSPI